MACLQIDKVKIAGISASVPKQQASNMELPLLSERERQQLVRTTGIAFRRIAPPEMCASDLCFEAAASLLKDLEWEADSVELLVFVSQSPDHLVPGTASQLQVRLGLSKQVMAIDLNQGCAGYVYGLSVVASLLASGGIKRALLLVGDTITHTLSAEDKSTIPIFSDAGSATALVHDAAAKSMFFNLQTDGQGYQAICIPDGGSRQPIHSESFDLKEVATGIKRGDGHLAMQGLDIFNFALREVAPNIRALLDFAKLKIESQDAFVLHQANLLLNESIRRKLALPIEKVPYSIKDFGNTSSATIPVTLVHALSERLRSESMQLILSGFGVGLSWGSVALETENIHCLPLIEC